MGLLASLGIVGAVVLLSGAKTELWKLTAFAAFPALGWAGAVGLVAIADRLVRRLAAEPPHTIRFADSYGRRRLHFTTRLTPQLPRL